MARYFFTDELVPLEQSLFLQNLFECKNLAKSDRLLGFSKGRGTVWFLRTQPEIAVNAVLRHYYRGGFFGKLVKDRYFFTRFEKTRAVKEADLLMQMHKWGLPVPRPIGVRIEKKCFWYQADIMLEKIENTQDLSKILQYQRLMPTQYEQIGQLIKKLHCLQVHHSDLNIHNILLDQQGKFWLIDFDKCKVSEGESWKMQNLNRLLRSFKKEQARLNIQFDERDWQAFLKGYQK